VVYVAKRCRLYDIDPLQVHTWHGFHVWASVMATLDLSAASTSNWQIARVTRWDCEKIAQNEAQPILSLYVHKYINVEKVFATKKSSQSKLSPDRRKFTQYVHSAAGWQGWANFRPVGDCLFYICMQFIENYRNSPHFGATHFRCKGFALILTKMVRAILWATFSQTVLVTLLCRSLM
jgi:hypothetical protein